MFICKISLNFRRRRNTVDKCEQRGGVRRLVGLAVGGHRRRHRNPPRHAADPHRPRLWWAFEPVFWSSGQNIGEVKNYWTDYASFTDRWSGSRERFWCAACQGFV